MGFFGWWKRPWTSNSKVDEWRRDWTNALERPSPERIQSLTERLQELGLSDDDLEIEEEMLEALERLVALAAEVDAEGLPTVETRHRIAGRDVCHFTAPAAMPDEPGQPSGRLLLTSVRAAFAGGSGSRTIPWHAVGEAAHHDRDLLLIRTDRETAYRFRCNSYGDAVCAVFIARRCLAPHRAVRRTRV